MTDWLHTYVDHLTGIEPYTKRKYRAYRSDAKNVATLGVHKLLSTPTGGRFSAALGLPACIGITAFGK